MTDVRPGDLWQYTWYDGSSALILVLRRLKRMSAYDTQASWVCCHWYKDTVVGNSQWVFAENGDAWELLSRG